MKLSSIFKLIIVFITLVSCSKENSTRETSLYSAKSVLNQHLNAISNRDLRSLKATLSPSDSIELILPGSPISYKVADFIKMHEGWFSESHWTFSPEIISFKQVGAFAFATVLIDYNEEERNGKPYYNRMHVSYVLERNSGDWFVIKDHACSFEKSSE
ncbi:YybH family protein [Fulvivirga lutimaris]|uniref:YybH family protein n=1 Tax=Fulvivirga lutimaris TaxID=1819566 RepID=UPI0012BB56C4|nr:nuclear transport factor 2 family protein [Fulvivirga lutimaris]MTI39251.1 hypothetical protein [Fulvivirga lutimaris]